MSAPKAPPHLLIFLQISKRTYIAQGNTNTWDQNVNSVRHDQHINMSVTPGNVKKSQKKSCIPLVWAWSNYVRGVVACARYLG